MKRFLLSIFFLAFATALFAHIDRPIDLLIFEGKTYDIYTQPINSFIKNDRLLRRQLLTNPVNPRIPKHYLATYEIRDKKLYLNKIDLIIVSEESMRFWRFPLALTYSYKPVSASAIFGKDAQYPILCDWFSGDIFATIFEGERDLTYLFSENTVFDIKEGNFLGKKDYKTRSVLSNCISIKEFPLLYKIFTDKSFGLSNMLFDLRLLRIPSLLSQEEFMQISNGQILKTRGYLAFDDKKRPYLKVPKTHKSPALNLSFFGAPSHDISNFKEGDRVEATIYFPSASFKRAGVLSLSHLADDELIHDPAFFMRLR